MALRFELNNHNAIIGVALNAFDRIGLGPHLPQYEIIAGRHDGGLELFRREGKRVEVLNEVPITNVSSLLEHTKFINRVQEYQAQDREVYLLITNITTKITRLAHNLGVQLVGNPIHLRQQFENKAQLRRVKELIPLLPPFQIVEKQELITISFDDVKNRFGSFVIQDESEQLSGGRGTVIVHSADDFERGVKYVQKRGGARVVISKFIAGRAASMQGCVTAQGVFHGPLQTQLYGVSGLVHSRYSNFAGGQWGFAQFSEKARQRAFECIKSAGSVMQESGYKGIFGVDLLVTDTDDVFMTEINARLTGLTPPLTLIQNYQGIPPLLLLHTLEHTATVYELDEPKEYQQQLVQEEKLSYAVLHNLETSPIRTKQVFPSGCYNIKEHQLQLAAETLRFDALQDNCVIIPDMPAPEQKILPGKQLLRMMTRDNVLQENGQLSPAFEEKVRAVYSLFSAA